jgi:hypothetical protein
MMDTKILAAVAAILIGPALVGGAAYLLLRICAPESLQSPKDETVELKEQDVQDIWLEFVQERTTHSEGFRHFGLPRTSGAAAASHGDIDRPQVFAKSQLSPDRQRQGQQGVIIGRKEQLN